MNGSFDEVAIKAIKDSAANADDAQAALDRVNAAVGTAGMQSTIEKFGTKAQTAALVSIAQSLSIIAAISLDNHIEKRVTEPA